MRKCPRTWRRRNIEGELNNSNKYKIREFCRDVEVEARKPSPALRPY